MTEIPINRSLQHLRVEETTDLPFRKSETSRRYRWSVVVPAFVLGVATGALAYFATGSVAMGIAAGSISTPSTIYLVEHFNLE